MNSTQSGIENPDSRAVNTAGFWASILAFIGAAGYSSAQILQVTAVLRPPLDGILIFGFSLLIATPFLVAMLALHYGTPDTKRFWSHAAVLFAVMYAIYVNLNYVVQLATVIPRSLHGPLDEIRVLDQTPHSLFWDVDGLGYIFMGLATVFAVPMFSAGGFERWMRWFFLANGVMTPVIALVYYYPTFSIALLLCGSPWILTACGSIWLLILFFKRKLRA